MHEEQRFRSALTWSYVMDVGDKVISVVISFVLAAILGPRIFGAMALALVYIYFIEMLVGQGLIAAIIHHEDLTDEHLDSAFCFVLACSVVGTALSVLLGDLWAHATGVAELRVVMPVLSLYLPLRALLLVQEAIFRRNLDFKTLALRVNLAALGSGLVGVGMAIGGLGIWALVGQTLTEAVIDVTVLWAVSPWRPRLRWSWARAKELLSYSSRNTFAVFGLFLSERSDAIIVGTLFGATTVGLYRFAARFVDMLLEFTLKSLQSVTLPSLSRLRNDNKAYVDRVGDLFKAAALTIPCLALLAGLAVPLCRLAGPEWALAAPVLQILCLAGVLRIVTYLASPMLQARGRPGTLAVLAWFGAIVGVGAFALAGALSRGSGSTRLELRALSFGRFAAVLLVTCFALFLLERICLVPIRAIVRSASRPTCAGLVIVSVLLLAQHLNLARRAGRFGQAAVLGFAGLAITVGSTWALVPWVRTQVHDVLRRINRGKPAELLVPASAAGDGE